jgi:hypothetical protein
MLWVIHDCDTSLLQRRVVFEVRPLSLLPRLKFPVPRKRFPDTRLKFPVPLRREFGWKPLNSFADWTSNGALDAPEIDHASTQAT